jgi:competence protein ComEA
MTLQRSFFLSLLLAASAGAWCGPVNINAADVPTLARELKGIGNAKAQAIVDYRQKHGAFRTLDELAMVKGISQKLIERNRADLRLAGLGAVAAGTPPKTANPVKPPVKPKAR